MLPGSHLHGRCEHALTDDPANVLLQGQTVVDVAEERAVMCPLDPGQASFHHGWTLHASMPNHGKDRRIGLNVQYVAPHMRQIKHNMDSAMLVRGKDRFANFRADRPAESDLEPAAVKWHRELERRYVEIAGGE
jgi:non-heme Fe2+,alpha-ketoglutarate-dependent halogenase